ncbi:MAG: 3-deoxy-D-manno-octulosonic-acid transferase, partial [Paracoccaceae bacterium]
MSLSLRLFLWVWSFVWTVGLPLILFYLWRRGKKDALYSQHIAERFGWFGRSFKGAIWVHAVSLGEMRSAVPMIRAMLARGDRVVTTHFTPAGRREAQSVFADDIATGQMQCVWVPLETAWAYRGFFRAFRPSCGLVMEIEIWPRMVFAAKRAGVPLFMCNAQYPRKSMARDAGGQQLRHQVMRGFAGALVKSQLQADRFASIGLTNIAVTGELRFDQPIPPTLLTAGQAARVWIGATDRRVITIASAIEGEDVVYLHAIAALRDDHLAHGLPAPLFIYVPRRPERFDEVAQTILASGLTLLRRSELFDEGLA